MLAPMKKKNHIHRTHAETVKRLKRASGHLQRVTAMLEAEKPCLLVSQQLHAVECAIRAAKKVIIHDHIDNCLDHAVGMAKKATLSELEEFKQITKYL